MPALETISYAEARSDHLHMRRSIKKVIDGFLFGLGFSLAMVIVLGFVALCGTAFVVRQGVSRVAESLSKGTPMETVEGVSLVSSRLSWRGDDIAVAAVITNSTQSRLEGMMAWIELSRGDGTLVDFSFDLLGGVEPLSQKDVAFVFAGVDHTNAIEDLTFRLEATKASGNK